MIKIDILKRYILLSIYSNKWKPGDKIPSVKQLAIRFDISPQTIKKFLRDLVANNLLESKERIGFYVNQRLFDIIPLSLRKKYDISLKEVDVNSVDTTFKLRKSYFLNSNNSIKVWVETTMDNNIFELSKYVKNRTFMWNLSHNGIIVVKFTSFFKSIVIDGFTYIEEKRLLYGENKILIAKEYIYVPINIWYDIKKIKI